VYVPTTYSSSYSYSALSSSRSSYSYSGVGTYSVSAYTSYVLISRADYYTPDIGTYLGDGSLCYENSHCASQCCSPTPGEDAAIIYEEDLEEIET